MKKQIAIVLLICQAWCGFGQTSLEDLLKRHNSHDVPYISVEELAMPKTEVVILDARSLEEYTVSHLKDAIHIGYETFKLDRLQQQISDTNKAIVVYCSLGIRSETIADKLKKAGYSNVRNLYGGIFEWKNKGFDIYNSINKKTDSVHVFSKTWSKWLLNGIKVYE
ncbi:MAG: rhodanese-like domain-containing protein [Algicola sp.]|nr:rhodanese-like domain-containing protein [Algicola sp.]